MGPFSAGDIVDLDFEFRDSHTNALVDPITAPSVRIQRTASDGTKGSVRVFTYDADANVIKTASGQYRASIDVDLPGTWEFSIISSGSIAKATYDGRFEVNPVLSS